VKVTSFGETLVGVAIDVDSDGALILEMEQGERKRVVAGDIEYRKMSNVKGQSSNKILIPNDKK
jgi:biotin-(acetyl-CoA carboxylase) ligase